MYKYFHQIYGTFTEGYTDVHFDNLFGISQTGKKKKTEEKCF